MSGWHSVSAGFRPGERRSASAQKDLVRAYRSVFSAGSDAETVLADLASHCGFYAVAGPGTPSDALQYAEGMRAAYARIFSFLSLPAERLAALETAARAESLAEEEG